MTTIKQDTIRFNFAESELANKIEGLPENYDSRRAVFTDEQDAVLLRYWMSGRNKRDIAKLIGFSYDICLRRFKELKAEGK